MTINCNPFSSPRNKKATRRRSSCLITQPSLFPAEITINHWQLRDLVQPSSCKKNEIFYTNLDTLRVTDRYTNKTSTVCKLDYAARCFKELDNNIVTGGLLSPSTPDNTTNQNSESSWNGLMSFYNRDTAQTLSIRLGTHINNSVSINKISNNQYNSYVCNNDQHLYNATINPSSITVKRSLCLDNSLNHSILSDDGKHLVVVGDCPNIYLVHPDERPSETLRQDSIIETSCISGFSTSFSSSGVQFATCFEEGTCLIYDLRNTAAGPLRKISSTRKNVASGAFRCVKYSRGTDDLLLISEHVGRVHVIDSRDFSNHQVIMLPVKPANSAITSRNNNRPPSSINESEYSSGLFVPRILDYSDVTNYEGDILGMGYGSESTPRSYGLRSLNNFNLLNALGDNCFEDYEPISDYNETECEVENEENTTQPLSEDNNEAINYTGSPHSEFDFSDNDISGVDWFEDRYGSHIAIGFDRGLISWEVDSMSRRSFPSFKLA